MAVITEKVFAEHIKTGAFSALYVLHGQENYIKSAAFDGLIGKAVPKSGRDFNLVQFDGKGLNLNELYNAVLTLPVFAQYRVVVVRDYTPKSDWASHKENLTKIFSALCDSVILIFMQQSVVFDKKSAADKAFLTLVNKFGCEVDFVPKDLAFIADALMKAAANRDCSLSSQTARHLINRCGTSLSELINECEKLCAYAKKGEITREDIDALCHQRMEQSIFDLSKAVMAKNSAAAFAIIDKLFYLREEPVVILAALSSAFIDLYRAKQAKDSGVPSGTAATAFAYYGMAWKMENAMRDTARYSQEQLTYCITELAEADVTLKSSGISGRLVLEKLIVNMISSRL